VGQEIKWYQKREWWGLIGIVGAVLTVIPGTNIIGAAVIAGASYAEIHLGVKAGKQNESESLIGKIVEKVKPTTK
jgi:hypothetical protein